MSISAVKTTCISRSVKRRNGKDPRAEALGSFLMGFAMRREQTVFSLDQLTSTVTFVRV